MKRADRNFAELLQELRVAQTGVQILFAFLLGLAFTDRFAELGDTERGIYIATLAACYLPGGHAPAQGRVFRNPGLARSLEIGRAPPRPRPRIRSAHRARPSYRGLISVCGAGVDGRSERLLVACARAGGRGPR